MVKIPFNHSYRGFTPLPIVNLSRGAEITLSVILTFLLTMVLGISIGVLAVNKWRRSKKVTLQLTETEMKPTPVIYEEPEDIKPDPHIQGNLAYGHVQFS